MFVFSVNIDRVEKLDVFLSHFGKQYFAKEFTFNSKHGSETIGNKAFTIVWNPIGMPLFFPGEVLILLLLFLT